jgi:hypothetical protein
MRRDRKFTAPWTRWIFQKHCISALPEIVSDYINGTDLKVAAPPSESVLGSSERLISRMNQRNLSALIFPPRPQTSVQQLDGTACPVPEPSLAREVDRQHLCETGRELVFHPIHFQLYVRRGCRMVCSILGRLFSSG